jgi:hypothetical protein
MSALTSIIQRHQRSTMASGEFVSLSISFLSGCSKSRASVSLLFEHHARCLRARLRIRCERNISAFVTAMCPYMLGQRPILKRALTLQLHVLFAE